MKPKSLSFVFDLAEDADKEEGNSEIQSNSERVNRRTSLEFTNNRHSTEENKKVDLDNLEIAQPDALAKSQRRQTSHNFREKSSDKNQLQLDKTKKSGL